MNTGWTGGAHGQGGQRFSIPTTRAIVTAIVNGNLREAAFETLPGFNLAHPVAVPNVDSHLLNPMKAWKNPEKYREYLNLLIENFIDNFKKFEVSDTIRAAGPVKI